MIRKEIEKLRGYVFTEKELEKVIRPAIVATQSSVELNESGFPNYIKVKELVEGDKEELFKYICVMYEKYNALYRAVRYMSPEYIEYLKKLDDYLDKIYFKQLLSCKTIEEEQITKLQLLKKEKNEVIDSVIKSDLKTKLEKLVILLQENIKELGD